MKRLSAAVILLIIILFCCGCSNEPELGEAFYNDVDNFPGVTITIDHLTVTSKGAKFEILNTTDFEVCSGKPYLIALQMEKDDQWYNLTPKKDNRASTSEAYIYYKNEPQIVSVNWVSDYGELPKGHYRIVKGFFITGTQSKTAKIENFILTDEFSIVD